MVRHRTLDPAFAGSNPASSAARIPPNRRDFCAYRILAIIVLVKHESIPMLKKSLLFMLICLSALSFSLVQDDLGELLIDLDAPVDWVP